MSVPPEPTDLEQRQDVDIKQFGNEKFKNDLSVDQQELERRGSLRILENLIYEGKSWT